MAVFISFGKLSVYWQQKATTVCLTSRYVYRSLSFRGPQRLQRPSFRRIATVAGASPPRVFYPVCRQPVLLHHRRPNTRAFFQVWGHQAHRDGLRPVQDDSLWVLLRGVLHQEGRRELHAVCERHQA